MAKNLRPCNFIVTKGGKEKSMSFDEMREYLLANPDVWMPSSTRKIGAGKMQASLGGREVPKAITVKDVIVKKSDDFANDGEYVVFDNDREIGRLWYDRSQKSWSNPNFYRPSAEPYSFKSIYGDVLGETKEDAVAEIVKRHNETKKEEKPKVSYVKDEILNNFLNILNDIKPLVVNPILQKEFVYDDRAALEFSRFNKGNLKEVELQDIAVFSKGKGEGMSVMKDITDAADKAGITLTLDAKPFGTGGLGKKDLINFYKKNGFVVDYEEAYGGEFDNEKDLIDYALENESEGVPMKRIPKEGAKLQFSEGGRGEGPKATDPNVRKAIIKAGQMFRESGNDKRAAISAGVDELVKAGYSKKDATDIITPVIERIMQPTAAGSSTSPAGWIAMKYIPQEVRNKIDVATTTVENMKALGEMAVKNGEVNPENLAQEFANGFSRPLSPVEVTAMVYYKAQLHNKITEAYKALEDAKRRNNASQIETEEANVAKLEQQLQNYYIASRKSAYEMGLAFRLRQMLLDQDYELIEVETKYRAKYGPIPAETKATFEELEKQRKELLEKEKQLELDREAFEREKTMAGLVQQVEQKKKGNDTGVKSDQSFIVRNILNNIAKIPSMFSRKIKGQASAGLRAGEQTDGEYIWEQAVTMAATELQKIDKPDKAAKDDAIKKGLEYIKSTKWYKSFDADERKQIDSEYMTFMRANTKDPSVKVTDDERIVISHKTLRDYTERVLEDNPLDKDDVDRYKKLMELVSKEILKDMAAELPLGTSWQDIRDAITKYGQQTQGSKEDLEVEIRKMKQLGLKMAQLEAVLSGNKPLKTGYQRDPQSPEARFLVEQINEGLKKLAISEMESEAFLRSSLDRIKTSLKNQIEDLEQQIKEGKRKVREKSKVVYDEEATTLKELRDLLKDQLDKIDPRGREISAEKQLNNLIANLERSIQEYERRIKEKDFSAFKQVKAAIENLPRTDEYKKLKDERDKLKKQFEDLKKGPQKSPLDKKLEDLQDEYDSLLDGTYQPKQPPVQYNDPRLKDLRDKISALKLQLGFKKTKEDIKLDKLRRDLSDLMTGTTRARTAPGPDSSQATALKNQIKNLKDQMGITAAAELSRAIKAKEAQLRKMDERIAKLRATGQDVVSKAKIENAIIDDLNDQIKDRKKIVQDLLDQHGITVKKLLEAEKKRIRKLIEEKEERIRTKNFGPKVTTTRKLTDDQYDQEMRDLQVQKQLLYERYEEEFYKAALAERHWAIKAVDFATAIWDAPKSAVSGLDMSAPLRQGLFEVLSQNPITTLGAFRFMFESAFGDIAQKTEVGQKYEEWIARVKSSPDYPIMKAAGLYLAEQTVKGKAAEESFANNLVYQIPFYERPVFESIKALTGKDINPFKRDFSLHLVKRSEVAYNAFLNYMRVAAFREVIQSLGDLDVPITYQTHPEEFKAIADVINISTGRPNLGRAESAATIINRVIFSIRLVWSRFIFGFLPAKAMFMPPAARKFALIKYGRAMGSLAAIMTLLYLWLDNDDDEDTYVEVDPRGKFVNVNINENTSINLTGGLSQWVSFLTKLVTEEYKKSSTGEIRRLGQTMNDPDWKSVIMDFIAGKASPSARVLMEYKMAQPNPEEDGEMITAFGERYSVLESLGGLAVPLILQEAAKTQDKNEIITAMGLVPMSFFGISVNVKGDAYKLPSEIMSEKLDPAGKDYKLEAQKVRVAIKQGNVEALKKGIEKQAVPYANYKMISNPDKETAKAMYAESLLKSYKNDDLVEKTGLKTDEMRQMFFLIMSGSELPEIKESNPVKKEAIQKMRDELIEKFKSIPEPTRQNILGQYKKQAKEVEGVIDLFNELGIKYKDQKTDQYKAVNWNDFLRGVQWYQEYEYFYKTYPNFRKQVDSK
jgi:hypothetical protein